MNNKPTQEQLDEIDLAFGAFYLSIPAFSRSGFSRSSAKLALTQGYLLAKKSNLAEIEKLKQELQATREQLEKCEHSLMKVACFETHGENKYISHEQAYTGVANFARQYFKQKDEVKGE